MAGFFNQFLNQLTTGDEIKDYRHAQKLFVDSLYARGPKSTALFHVFVEFNPNANGQDSREIGMLAKSVQLPKFNIQSKILNAYNRKNVVQERINYDPVTITFHDDNSDIVRNFWVDYYNHYYRDADYSGELYKAEHKYKNRLAQDWGYSPRSSEHYITAIRIYSLHQKSFSSYVLFKPTISNFQHGQHTAGNYELMEHSMTFNYEAIHYETGMVSNGNVLGFGELHYDRSPSPLSILGGGTQSILGPGGLVSGISDVVNNVSRGNFLGAALGAVITAKNAKNVDLKRAAGTELLNAGTQILRGQNPQSSVFFPTRGSVIDGLARSTNVGRIDL
jgi:hypothetical protein